MNTMEIIGNWNIVRGKFKQKLAQWMGDELQFVEGKENELIGRIQRRTGRGSADFKSTQGRCHCRSK